MAKWKKHEIKGWKNVTLIAAVAVFVFGVFFLWLNWEGSSKEIISVADQFKADSSWKLKGETIVPPKLCVAGQGPCPMLSRTWTTKDPVSHEQLQSILDDSSWRDVYITRYNCGHQATSSDSLNCSASGTVGGYSVSIDTLDTASTGGPQTISLYIK